MDDPKQIYEQKRQSFEKAQDNLEEFVEKLRGLANTLDRWDRILLPGETKERNDLYNLGYAEPHALDPDDWPTFEVFLDALQQWRIARHEAQSALDALEDVEGIESLPELPLEREEHLRRERLARATKKPRPPRPRGPRTRSHR